MKGLILAAVMASPVSFETSGIGSVKACDCAIQLTASEDSMVSSLVGELLVDAAFLLF